MQRLRLERLALTSMGAAMVLSVPALAAEPLCDKSQIRLVNMVHELAQPYHGLVVGGGKALAESLGLAPEQYVVLVTDRDPDKEVSRLRSLAVSNAECTVFNVEPAADQGVQSLVDAVNETGAWLVTHWAHGGQSHPFDEQNSQWIAHVAVPSLDAGVVVSEELAKALDGQGGIVALQGNLANDPAVQRFAGLKQVLDQNPGITLLDDQTATWDRTKAFPIAQAWLSKYGDEIDAIWAANDAMAFGALEALRAAGLEGKVLVTGLDGTPEAIAAVQSGEMLATAASDGYYQGSIGLAMGYCVLTGQVPPPSEWTKEQREFNLRIVMMNKDNADEYAGEPDPAKYAAEDWACDKLWARSTGPAF